MCVTSAVISVLTTVSNAKGCSQALSEGVFLCFLCAYTPIDSQLKLTQPQAASQIPSKAPTKTNKKSVQCPNCKKTFGQNLNLKRHQETKYM